EPRDTPAVVVLAVPEVASDGEDVRRRVSGDAVKALGPDLLLHLDPLRERARVEVRAGVEHLVRGVEQDAALPLAGRDDAPHAYAARQRGDRRPRTPREHGPEGPGVEVEAAHERHARVGEQPVVERLLRRGERTAAGVEGDAAAGTGAGVEGDGAVHGRLGPAR